MAIHAGAVAVGTTATLIYQTPAEAECSITVRVQPSGDVFVGDSSVTTATGLQLNGSFSSYYGCDVTIPRFTGALYGISGGSSSYSVFYLVGDVG